MLPPNSLPITEDDWNKTPKTVQVLILTLWDQIAALQQQVADLKQRVNQNSKNSSRPPSSDLPSVEKPIRRSSGRKRGGQPGHKGVSRRLKPPEEVTAVIPVKPAHCDICNHPVSGEDSAPTRHQVTEVPQMTAETIEYQLHTLQCPECQNLTRGKLPKEVPTKAFGPRLCAMVAALSGNYHLSKRQITQLLDDFFGVSVSLGTVHTIEQQMSAALDAPVAEVSLAIQQQGVVNVDETSWPEGENRGWLWVAVTPIATRFLLRLSRGSKVVKELITETFDGIVCSDRWSGYNFVDPIKRQVCWAHLLRDFEAIGERGGISEKIGHRLLLSAQQMFHLFHRVRDGTFSRHDFCQAMIPIKQRVATQLRMGAECDHKTTQRTCKNLLKLETSLWTFVETQGVEPTNNAAERAVRSAVLWRKSSFGTQNEKGSLFVERMMTT
jgi:transposase